jgi:hypothetical protein
MVLEKKQSSSFKARSGADMMALEIVLQTGGVGIGLGSHKPNNLAMTLLSNTGIVGFLVFGIFLLGLLWPRPATSPGLDIRPYRWMILGLLSVHMISNPNFNPIMLWISLAVIVGALAAQGTSPMVSTCRTPVRTAGVAPGFSAQRTPWQRPAARLPTGRSV